MNMRGPAYNDISYIYIQKLQYRYSAIASDIIH